MYHFVANQRLTKKLEVFLQPCVATGMCVAEPDAGEFKGLDLSAPSLVPRLIPPTVFDFLQYADTEGGGWEIWSHTLTSG